VSISSYLEEKYWRKIIKRIKKNYESVFVYTNNKLETSVFSLKKFHNLQEIIEATQREKLGQQMVCDLLKIAQLTDQSIKHMILNQEDIFEEMKSQDQG
jgi:hypothetical protein